MASLAEGLLQVMSSQKGLKLFFVGSFAEINRTDILQVRLHKLHQSTEPIPFLIESEEEVNATILGEFSLCDFQSFGLIRQNHEA